MIESHSHHKSSWGVDVVACARVSAVPVVSATASSSAAALASPAVVAHARSTPMHVAVNSWSDTGTVQGPTGKSTKGGVSGPSEDLHPVSEVEAGVNCRSAGGVRRQVAGSLPGRQPGTGTRRFLIPNSCHLGADWASGNRWAGRRCVKPLGRGSGCQKGNARARVFSANLDCLRVEWRKQGSYETAWVTPGRDCLCSYQYAPGAAVRPQTHDATWVGVIGLWGSVAPFLVTLVCKREYANGSELEPVRWSRIMHPLAQR